MFDVRRNWYAFFPRTHVDPFGSQKDSVPWKRNYGGEWTHSFLRRLGWSFGTIHYLIADWLVYRLLERGR